MNANVLKEQAAMAGMTPQQYQKEYKAYLNSTRGFRNKVMWPNMAMSTAFKVRPDAYKQMAGASAGVLGPEMLESAVRATGGLGLLGKSISHTTQTKSAAMDKLYAKQLGGLGKVSRGLNISQRALSLSSLPMYMGMLASGSKGLEGFRGLGQYLAPNIPKGATMAQSAGAMATSPLMMLGMATMVASVMKARKLAKITATKTTGSTFARKHSLTKGLPQQINSLLSKQLITPGESLISQILCMIESHTSVIPELYAETDFLKQQKTKGIKGVADNYKTTIEKQESDGFINKLLDKMEYGLGKASKYDPVGQLFTFLFTGKTPKHVQDELDKIYGSKDKTGEAKEERSHLGVSFQQQKMVYTTASSLISAADSYEGKSITLLAGIYDVSRFNLLESMTIRTKGFGIDKQAINVAGKENTFVDDIKNFVKAPFKAVGNIPGLNALFNIAGLAGKIIKAPFKVAETARSGYDKVRSFVLGGTDEYLKDPRKLLKKAGVYKTESEKAYDALAYGIPDVLEEVRVLEAQQLEVQKNLYEVQTEMLHAMTGTKHTYKDVGGESKIARKWSQVSGAYLNKAQQAKEEEDISGRISMALARGLKKSPLGDILAELYGRDKGTFRTKEEAALDKLYKKFGAFEERRFGYTDLSLKDSKGGTHLGIERLGKLAQRRAYSSKYGSGKKGFKSQEFEMERQDPFFGASAKAKAGLSAAMALLFAVGGAVPAMAGLGLAGTASGIRGAIGAKDEIKEMEGLLGRKLSKWEKTKLRTKRFLTGSGKGDVLELGAGFGGAAGGFGAAIIGAFTAMKDAFKFENEVKRKSFEYLQSDWQNIMEIKSGGTVTPDQWHPNIPSATTGAIPNYQQQQIDILQNIYDYFIGQDTIDTKGLDVRIIDIDEKVYGGSSGNIPGLPVIISGVADAYSNIPDKPIPIRIVKPAVEDSEDHAIDVKIIRGDNTKEDSIKLNAIYDLLISKCKNSSSSDSGSGSGSSPESTARYNIWDDEHFQSTGTHGKQFAAGSGINFPATKGGIPLQVGKEKALVAEGGQDEIGFFSPLNKIFAFFKDIVKTVKKQDEPLLNAIEANTRVISETDIEMLGVAEAEEKRKLYDQRTITKEETVSKIKASKEEKEKTKWVKFREDAGKWFKDNPITKTFKNIKEKVKEKREGEGGEDWWSRIKWTGGLLGGGIGFALGDKILKILSPIVSHFPIIGSLMKGEPIKTGGIIGTGIGALIGLSLPLPFVPWYVKALIGAGAFGYIGERIEDFVKEKFPPDTEWSWNDNEKSIKTRLKKSVEDIPVLKDLVKGEISPGAGLGAVIGTVLLGGFGFPLGAMLGAVAGAGVGERINKEMGIMNNIHLNFKLDDPNSIPNRIKEYLLEIPVLGKLIYNGNIGKFESYSSMAGAVIGALMFPIHPIASAMVGAAVFGRVGMTFDRSILEERGKLEKFTPLQVDKKSGLDTKIEEWLGKIPILGKLVTGKEIGVMEGAGAYLGAFVGLWTLMGISPMLGALLGAYGFATVGAQLDKSFSGIGSLITGAVAGAAGGLAGITGKNLLSGTANFSSLAGSVFKNAGIFGGLITAIIKFTSGEGNFSEALWSGAGAGIGAILGQLIIPIPLIGAMIGSVLGEKAGDYIGKKVSDTQSSIITWIDSSVGALYGSVNWLFTSGPSSLLTTIWKSGFSKVLTKIPFIGAAVGSVVNLFLGHNIGEAVGGGVGAGIGAILGQLIIPIPVVGAIIGSVLGGQAGEYIGGKFDELTELTKKFKDIKEWVTNLTWDKVKSGINIGVKAVFPGLISDFDIGSPLDYITKNWKHHALGALIGQMLVPIPGIGALIGALMIPQEMTRPLEDNFSKVINIIKNPISSLWEGTKSVAGSVWEGTKSVAGSVYQGAKNLIGLEGGPGDPLSTVKMVGDVTSGTTESMWSGETKPYIGRSNDKSLADFSKYIGSTKPTLPTSTNQTLFDSSVSKIYPTQTPIEPQTSVTSKVGPYTPISNTTSKPTTGSGPYTPITGGSNISAPSTDTSSGGTLSDMIANAMKSFVSGVAGVFNFGKDAVNSVGDFLGIGKQSNNSSYGSSGSSGSSGNMKSSANVAQRIKTAMDFFTSKGLSREQAAGVVGNLYYESRELDPAAVGDKGTSFGLAQWHNERGTAMKNFVGSNWANDFSGQLNYVWKELNQDYPKVLQRIKNTSSVYDSTGIWLREFEKPKDQSDNAVQTRTKVSNHVLSVFDNIGSYVGQGLAGGAGLSSPGGGRFPLNSGMITSRPGERWGKAHKGYDIGVPNGTPVYASFPGEVIWSSPQNGYHNLVAIKHANGIDSKYAHLSSINVQNGQQVNAGDQIGTTGKGHLHWEFRKGLKIDDPVILPEQMGFAETLQKMPFRGDSVNPKFPGVAVGGPGDPLNTFNLAGASNDLFVPIINSTNNLGNNVKQSGNGLVGKLNLSKLKDMFDELTVDVATLSANTLDTVKPTISKMMESTNNMLSGIPGMTTKPQPANVGSEILDTGMDDLIRGLFVRATEVAKKEIENYAYTNTNTVNFT